MKKNKLIGFKGFYKDMTCRGFQYKEGKTYKMEEEPEICNKGFHFCEYPLDCFNYYEPAESVFHKVESTGKIDKENDNSDTKISTNEIKIGARLSWKDIVDASIEFVMKHAKKGSKGTNKRTDRSVASNTGNRSVASNTGDRSVASNTGDSSVASNTGNRSVASNTGYRSVASNTGDSSVASNTGDSSVASNTGNRSVASNTGKSGISSNLGIYGQAAGKIGTWLVLAEWVEKGWEYELKEVKTVKVDGKKIEEDTYYSLEDGKFVEKGKVEDEWIYEIQI